MKDIQPGDRVGYHGRWAATGPTRLALVGIGYGDGYPRHVRRGVVSIRGRTLPVVGRISMDSLSVDATALADCAVGDEVELWGSQVRAADVAENADTIDYQLFTGLANRVHRSWIE